MWRSLNRPFCEPCVDVHFEQCVNSSVFAPNSKHYLLAFLFCNEFTYLSKIVPLSTLRLVRFIILIILRSGLVFNVMLSTLGCGGAQDFPGMFRADRLDTI